MSILTWITCQKVLHVLVILALTIATAIQLTVPLAIEEMTKITISNDSKSQNELEEETLFNWDESQKRYIIHSTYWAHIVAAMPGGYFVDCYGPRRALGGALLISSILTFMTPLAGYINYYVLLVVRILLGILLGTIYPSVMQLAARWFSSSERSKFLSVTMAASLGVFVGIPVDNSILSTQGWASVFYITGAAGLITSCLWNIFIFNAPDKHPRIDKTEKSRITKALAPSNKNIVDQPDLFLLKNIFWCAPLWAVVLADAMFICTAVFLVIYIPKFFEEVFLVDTKQYGIFMNLAQLGRLPVAIVSGVIADKLIEMNKIPTSIIRKIFVSIALLLPSVLLLCQSVLGENLNLSIIFLTLTLLANGTSPAGSVSNMLDIGPAYCGTIRGTSISLGYLLVVVLSEVLKNVTLETSNYDAWKKPFLILAGTNLMAYVCFLLFASGEIQKWNYKKMSPENARLNPA